MVTCKESRAIIIALHKKGFTGKDIAASKIAPKSTIYWIIKNFKESSLISEKKLVWRRQGERYRQSCVMPTVKHPETIHVWGCFSAKGVDLLKMLPKNTAMNKEWYQYIL